MVNNIEEHIRTIEKNASSANVKLSKDSLVCEYQVFQIILIEIS